MTDASDLTKLTRWVIPGWLTYLAFYVFVSIDIVFSPSGQRRIFPSIGEFINSMTEINAILTIILVAAAGVPLGFIIYQIYFYLRWNSPFSRDGLLPPLITGRMNDLKIITKDIEFNYQGDNNRWREEWVKHPLFIKDHKFRWRYIELLFYEATQQSEEKNDLVTYIRHRYLHEVTHTLGASIVALYVGFLGYCFLKFYLGLTDISKNIVVIVALVTILFFLLNREDKVRQLWEEKHTLSESTVEEPIPAYDFDLRVFGRDKWEIGVSIVYPGALYLYALASLHWMLNPIFFSENKFIDIVLRSLLLVLGIVIWILSINKSYKRTRNGYYIVLGFSLLITILFSIFRGQIYSMIDWPLFTNLLIFLFANLILFNNRKNANDDMSALEYYTLKNYLTKEHN